MKTPPSGIRGVFWRDNANGSQELKFEGKKRKGEWWIRYTCSYGHLHREKVGPKALARDEYFRRKTEVRRESYCPNLVKNTRSPLFRDVANQYVVWAKANKRSWMTDEYWLRRLRRFFGNKTLEQILPADIERFKNDLSKTHAKATVNRHIACLKHLFSIAIRDGKAVENPAKKIRMFRENNQRVRYLTPEEEQSLFALISEPYQSFCQVALYTGLRKSEILNLKWQNIDLRANIITIEESKHGSVRRVPMSSHVKRVLKSIPRRLDNPSIFQNCKNISHRFPMWVKKAGIEDFRFHDLRYTFASRLAMGGEQLLTIKELLGHKTIEMTLRYSHLSPDHKYNAVEKLTEFAHKDIAVPKA